METGNEWTHTVRISAFLTTKNFYATLSGMKDEEGEEGEEDEEGEEEEDAEGEDEDEDNGT